MLLPDFSILESSIWVRLEAKACQVSYQKLEPLTSVIRDRWNKMDDDVTQCAFGAFRCRLHLVIGAEGDLIELFERRWSSVQALKNTRRWNHPFL